MRFLDTDLMLNQDGSTYHLHAFPEDIAQKVIFVGEGARALQIAERFDRIELERHHRGFMVITGYLGSTRITVVNTAIGCGNIDIVLNELDALVNIDLSTQQAKPTHTSLEILRLGTAGAIQPDIEPGQLVIASHAVATDGLLSYYDTPVTDSPLSRAIASHLQEPWPSRNFYLTAADPQLMQRFQSIATPGITYTSVGFYGPQYRQMRLPASQRMRLDHLQSFESAAHRFVKLEMETANIYGLGHALGHRCCSLSTIVVNRITQRRSENAAKAVGRMIDNALTLMLETVAN